MPKPKISFHHGLFYGAMCHWLGREPDQRADRGWDGFYDYLYYPKDDAEKKRFEERAQWVRGWLDNFEITFSSSRVE